MSFSEGLDKCLRTSIPAIFLALTLFGLSSTSLMTPLSSLADFWPRPSPPTETITDYTINDLLLGSHDPFFAFLVPLFGLISIGVCVMLNYAALLLTHTFAFIYSTALKICGKGNEAFRVSSLRRRLGVTSVLIFLVWTVVPYQFLFIVLCIAQLATCVRAASLAGEEVSYSNCHSPISAGLNQPLQNDDNNQSSHTTIDFHNYAHSTLILMLWVLPINLPTLVVWIHNLTVHWLTPFSSHHNVLSILPFVLLVETLSTGKMIPRLQLLEGGMRGGMGERTMFMMAAHHITSVMLFAMAFYAAVYGVTYAYLLHFIVNGVAAWLMVVYYASGRESGIRGVTDLLENEGEVPREEKDGIEVAGEEEEEEERSSNEEVMDGSEGGGSGKKRGGIKTRQATRETNIGERETSNGGGVPRKKKP